MDNFFQDSFRVNMGNKKQEMTKDQLLKQNREERTIREKARREANAATMIQKYMRSHKSNNKLWTSIIGDSQIKLRETITVFKVITIKKPD